MAYRPVNGTPAKKGYNNAGMIPGTRNPMGSGSANLNGGKPGATNLKSFMTPHKPSTYMEDSDGDNDDHTGGGAKLTPQPRSAKSAKPEKSPMRSANYDDYSVDGGGASLTGPRRKAQNASLFSTQEKRVAFAATIKQAVDVSEDEYSDDEVETVTTTDKTAGTAASDATLGSSPATVLSQAYSNTTPKTSTLTGNNAAQFTQTAPATFDLTANINYLVGQVISRATQSTPGSKSVGDSVHSPGLVTAQPLASQDVFQNRRASASPFKQAPALAHRGNTINPDIFRQNTSIASPGSASSSLFQRDSYGSNGSNGISPGKVQLRTGFDISWDDLLLQIREGFSQLNIPQLHDQPAGFHPGMPASDMLNLLTSGFTTRPDFGLATSPQYEPFVAAATTIPVTMNPVVKIDELPYEAKVSDIIAFMGGNAKILNDSDEPVHIMMERLTAKTGSAYVEFYDFDSAMKAVDKHRLSKAHGKPTRIGSRIVTVSISSQDALLKDLFPYAREVQWRSGQPYIQVPPEEFKGFVMEEELVQLVKNVEFPHRVQFAKGSPQRSVETLISIVKKLPWHMAAYITIRQRYSIYKTVADMIQALQGAIYNHTERRSRNVLPYQPHHHSHHQQQVGEVLNEKLLKRVVRAAMICPGFTPLMKDNIAFISSLGEREMAEYRVPANANCWRHVYALIPNPNVPGDVVEYFIALVRQETTRMVDALPAALRRRVRAKAAENNVSMTMNGNTNAAAYFGFFWAVVGFPDGEEFDKMSLLKAGELELSAVDGILARVLPQQTQIGGLITGA